MAYSRTVWQDKIKDETGQVIQEGTPLSAQNLNNIEAGIEENTEQLLSIEKNVDNKINDFKIATEEMLIEAKKEVKKECRNLTKKVGILIAELPSTPATYELNATDTEWKSFEFDKSYSNLPNVTGTISNDEKTESLIIRNISKKGFIYRNSFEGIINIRIEVV